MGRLSSLAYTSEGGDGVGGVHDHPGPQDPDPGPQIMALSVAVTSSE